MRSLFALLFAAQLAFAQETPPAPAAQNSAPGSTEIADERYRLLERRLELLESSHRDLERRLEDAQARAESKAAQTPLISFGPTGMVLRTPDGKTTIQTRGL